MATYIGQVALGGNNLPVASTLYGTCATAANTAAKVVTCANFDKLITGVTIYVKFTYSNSVANPTLNVNSTGAKVIYRYGTTAPSTSAATSWQAGSVVAFTYDGTYWQMVGWLNNNDMRTAASAAPLMDGTAAVGTSAKYAREDHVHPTDTSRAPVSTTVTNVAWDGTNKKLTKTINGSTSDIVTASTLKTDLGLSSAMLFMGSLGTDGTITSLPAAAAGNQGYTYKVITANTYANQAAKVGDVFVSNGSSWVLIPSGDEPSGTVTSVGVSNATNGGLTVTSSPITTSGTISIGHTNVLTNAQTTQALYPIKIDKNGHISAYGTAVTSLPASDVSAWAKASTKPSYALSEITGASDVQAIEALSGTSGLLKKTAANTWTLDTTAYTTNTGTVTKVTAGTGLAIGSTAQGNFTTSGTINHTNSVTAKTAAAQSAKTLTWGGTFTLYEEKYDTCGHITGVASYNMTMPSNPNTDIKQNITLATTSKAYLTGVTTAPTSSAQALTGVADTGVYLTATAGEISAVRHSFNVSGTEKAYMVFNSTTNAIDFIFN